MNGKRIITLALIFALCISLLPGCAFLPSFDLRQLFFPAQDEEVTAETAEAQNQATTAPETTPAETTPATEPTEATEATEPPATEPQNDPNLLKENQKKINTFLSNFAEQSLNEYPTSDITLLHFVCGYCKVNANSKLHVDEDRECYYVKKKDADAILKDLIGRTVTIADDDQALSGQNGVIYYKDRYEYPLADGEMMDYVAIVDRMVKNADGTYTVDFDVYFMEGDISNVYYSYSAAKAAKSSDLSWEYSGGAIVKDHVRANGKVSYLLIEYWTE